MQKEKILIVEDERIVSIDLKYILTNLGYDVVEQISKGYEAIEYTLKNKVDAILMDIGLRGDIDGIETAIEIKKNIEVPIVFVTANSDESTLQRSKEANPQGYILKPFNDREIRTTLEMAIFKHDIDLKMKESEEWLFTTLKSIGDAVIATDKDGNVKFMNHIAENLTGWTQEEAKGKQLNEVFVIVNEYTRKTVENPVEKVFREGKIVGLANHTILISRNNKEYHIDDAAAPIKNRQDIIDGVVLTFRDITDKKEIENQLSETQTRFSLFMDNSPTVSWIKDPKDWGFIYINKRFRDVFKLDNESVKGLTDFDIWDKKTAEQFRKNDIKVFKENKSVVTYEYEHTKNGEFKKWLSFKFPVKLPSGEMLVGGTALDITNNDILEDKLKYNEQFVNTLFDDSEDACFLVDYTTGFIVNCNKKALEIFEFESIEEILGKTGSILHNDPIDQKMKEKAYKTLDEKNKWFNEIEYRTNKGKIFWGKIKAYKFDAIDKEYSLVKIADITENKLLEKRATYFKNQLNEIKNDLMILNKKEKTEDLEKIIQKLDSL